MRRRDSEGSQRCLSYKVRTHLRKHLMFRDITKVVQSMSRELTEYLNSSEHGGSRMGELFVRTQSLEKFGDHVVKTTASTGYLGLFFYEYMHEKVCIKYREETDSQHPESSLRTSRDIRGEHNKTLVQLVSHWKSRSNPSGTASAMKVVSHFILLLTVNRLASKF